MALSYGLRQSRVVSFSATWLSSSSSSSLGRTFSSTFSPGRHAGHTIAGFGLCLLTFVIVQVQVAKVNDVIILILKADFLSQTRFSVSVLVVLALSKLLDLSQSLNGILALLPPP